MALTITYPDRVTPAYNPVLIEATSDVSDQFTIGSVKEIDSVSNIGGFCQLVFSAAHGLQKGDYILTTVAPGASSLLGVALVTAIVDTETIRINKPYLSGITDIGEAYKYLNNYNAYLKIYVYTQDAPSTAKFVGDKNLKPKFDGGVCKFIIDMAGIIKDFNYDGFAPSDVLKFDLIPSGEYVFVNEKSFVHWGVEITEAFDNPVGGVPEYIEDIEA